ncbi:MAG: hypothetical protein FIA97_09140 [Methylococcaceae bacterium]|nr:hypothetical protein [Methylococcaceae bacterium]
MAVLLPAMAWAETFKIKTVALGAGRIVSQTGSRTVEAGGDLTFDFHPKTDAYEVVDVKIDGVSVGLLASYTFSAGDANHRLLVRFKRKRFTVSSDIAGDAQGGRLKPTGKFIVNYGASKVFRVKPATDMTVSLFLDGELVQESQQPGQGFTYKLKHIDSDHALAAVFSSAGGNRAPVAAPLSLSADPSAPYVEAQLIGNDLDHDTLSFELAGDTSGTGYDDAYINPDSGKLYVSLSADFNGKVKIPFRVSDSKEFSPSAVVSILVQPQDGNKGTGGLDVNPQTYAGFEKKRLSSGLLGAPGGAPTEPESVDLSSSFPSPGDQGQQGSCVAWATGYALKSYQEGVEMQWSLNTTSHLFSPAFIYNQVNGGQDGGSQIYDALDLIIAKGAATWD